MVDGYEPHDHILAGPQTHGTLSTPDGRGEGVPGVWDREGGWEGYTGYLARPSQDPIFSIFKAISPTYGQMKAIYEVFMRFPSMGLERVQKRSRIDLRIDLPDTSQTGPEIALRSLIPGPQDINGPE